MGLVSSTTNILRLTPDRPPVVSSSLASDHHLLPQTPLSNGMFLNAEHAARLLSDVKSCNIFVPIRIPMKLLGSGLAIKMVTSSVFVALLAPRTTCPL